MKLTIVLDTDDLEGLKDAHKISTMMVQKYAPAYNPTGKSVLSKIDLIKLVRAYGAECQRMLTASEKTEEKPRFDGLREVKRFIDARYDSFTKAS
jgi:hypothetical protein